MARAASLIRKTSAPNAHLHCLPYGMPHRKCSDHTSNLGKYAKKKVYSGNFLGRLCVDMVSGLQWLLSPSWDCSIPPSPNTSLPLIPISNYLSVDPYDCTSDSDENPPSTQFSQQPLAKNNDDMHPHTTNKDPSFTEVDFYTLLTAAYTNLVKSGNLSCCGTIPGVKVSEHVRADRLWWISARQLRDDPY